MLVLKISMGELPPRSRVYDHNGPPASWIRLSGPPQLFPTSLLRAASKGRKVDMLEAACLLQAHRACEYPLGDRIVDHAEAKLPEQGDSFRIVLDYLEHFGPWPDCQATGSHGHIGPPTHGAPEIDGPKDETTVTSTHALMPISGNAHL